jgi:hypothetical protein
MALKDLKSKLQNSGPGKRPGDFEFKGDSTLHQVSSTYGRPAFSTYKSVFLRGQRPVDPSFLSFLFPEKPKKYLDNLPG